MHTTLLNASEALETIADDWKTLQTRVRCRDNSNEFARVEQYISSHENDKLNVIFVYNAPTQDELYALCVMEQHPQGLIRQQTLANWISSPGLNSSPLLLMNQRYSALNAILENLRANQITTTLKLRHLLPSDPSIAALQQICNQLGHTHQLQQERQGALREIQIELSSAANNKRQPIQQSTAEQSSSNPLAGRN